MKIVSCYLKESLCDLPRSCELVDKIVSFLSRVSLTKEILDASKIGSQLVEMRDKDNLSESVKAKWFKYFTKYKSMLEEWKEEYQKRKSSSQGQKVVHKSKEKKKGSHGDEVKKKRKGSDDENQRKNKKMTRKCVRFIRDDELVSYKIFRRDDEPIAAGLKADEHRVFLSQYQEQVRMMSSYTADEIKHHESQMEGRSHKQMIDNVQLMVEQISFSKPMKLKIEKYEEVASRSQQWEILTKRAELKLAAYYNLEDQIPKEPGCSDVSNTSLEVVAPKMITVTIPNDDEIINQVKQLCEKTERELCQMEKNSLKKQMKSILKKTLEQIKKKEQDLKQEKETIQPKMQELFHMLQNRQAFGEEELFALIKDIIFKLKQTGQAKYISNITVLITSLIEQSKKSKDDLEQQRQQQFNFITAQRKQMQQQRQFQIAHPKGYKTKLCVHFQSTRGCPRGEQCNFIHDHTFLPQPTQPINNNFPSTIPNLLNPNLFPNYPQSPCNPIAYLLPPFNNIRFTQHKYDSL